MNKDSPYLPPKDVKVERAIGRFIVAWGALEREIDGAIHELMLTSLGTGIIITANLAIRAKLDLAHALFEKLRASDETAWRPISAEWEQRFDTLVNMTAKANTDSRIPIVHSQPQVIRLESGDHPLWIRMAARKGGLRGTGVTYTKAFLDKQTEAVIKLVHEWAAIRAHWKHALDAMRSADADEWLGRRSNEPDHLIIHLQPGGGTRKATHKQSQPRKPSNRVKPEVYKTEDE